MSSPGRVRRVAISAFVVVHALALVWWNFGVVKLRPAEQEPPGGDAWTRMHEAADAVDGQRRIRGALSAYIRVGALFQQWILFGPDAPHESGRIEVWGVTGFDATQQPTLDPRPLHVTEAPDLTDTTQMIGNPPCGWSRADSPKATFLRASYAQFHLAEASRERGVDYVGVQFLCLHRPIREPGMDPEELPWTTEVLWAGPAKR